MPHLVLQHSPDLTDKMANVAKAVYDAAHASDIVPNKIAIKVRSIACDNILMTSEKQDFVHLTAYLLSGRSVEEKAQLADELLAALAAQLPEVGSLSVDPRDMDAATFRKRAL